MKSKTKSIIFLICLGIFFVSLITSDRSVSYDKEDINSSIDIEDKNNIKTSDPEIIIITPENETYINPMSGYYPATYGFENDEIGSNPNEFETYENGGSVQVIDGLGDHRRVVELYDSENMDRVFLNKSLSQLQTYGTIEFWIRTNDTTKTTMFAVSGTGGSPPYISILHLSIQDGYWKHRPSTSDLNVPNVAQPQNNTWYQVTVHFRCANAPTYMGLPSSPFASWKVIIDGIDSGQLSARSYQRTHAYAFLWLSNDSYTDYYTYVDGVGVSWDADYTLGDNLNEGILLSFENNDNLDWMGYSLDGQANTTILGNTTISIPAEGFHTIQVFGNDTIGTKYQSLPRSFTIDTFPPNSSIKFTPYRGTNITIDTTMFEIYADDLISGVSQIMYNINSTGWQVYTDSFNLIGQPLGIYNISYYAVDLGGNIESMNLIQIELVEKDTSPSYNGGGDDDDKKKQEDAGSLIIPLIIIAGVAVNAGIITVVTILKKKEII
ncbi:MAG: hypothetical protein ACFFAO_00520 [Candidatus Hermodarchaeota archaeon]